MAKTGKNQKMKMLAIYTEIATNCRDKKTAISTQALVDKLNGRDIACDGRVLSKEIDGINEYIFRYIADGVGDFDKNSKDNAILKLTKKHGAYYYYFNPDSPYLAGKNQKMKMLAIYMEIAANYRNKGNAASAQTLADELIKRNIPCDSSELSKEIDEINEYIFISVSNGNGIFNKDSQGNVIIKRGDCFYFNAASPYLKNASFRFGELLFLYDAVTSAYFMPHGMVSDLHDKLNELVKYCRLEDQERSLRSHLQLRSQSKYYHKNSEVLESADKLCLAIDNKRYISFRYCNVNKYGEPEVCKTGSGEEERVVIPVALYYSGGYYYLRAIPVGTDNLCSFRLDKMEDIQTAIFNGYNEYDNKLTAEQKDIIDKYKKGDTRFLFMGDRLENKRSILFSFRFTENHIGDVLDKFGMDTKIKEDGGWYLVKDMDILPTKELYVWFAQFGTEMQITSPRSVIDGYKAYLSGIVEMYK